MMVGLCRTNSDLIAVKSALEVQCERRSQREQLRMYAAVTGE
jgi:hypothetical protein